MIRFVYNYYRYYDPSTGRYITSDPIGLGGGLNTYGYVGGDPVNEIDLFGLWIYLHTKKYQTHDGKCLSDNILIIESIVDEIYNETVGHDAVVTATTNGKHGLKNGGHSSHYSGNAVDLRDTGMTLGVKIETAIKIQYELDKFSNPGDNQVLVDDGDPHIHIQYHPPGSPPSPTRDALSCGCR